MGGVHTQVDVTEGAATDLATDAIFVADAEILLGVSISTCGATWGGGAAEGAATDKGGVKHTIVVMARRGQP